MLLVCNARPPSSQLGALGRQIAGLWLVTPQLNVHYGENLSGTGLAKATMDELIGRLAADLGVDRAAVEKAVGIILDFLAKEAPADKVQAFMAHLPGAEALQQQAAAEGGGGMGGVMGAGMRMMAAGLSMGQVQDVTRQFIAFAREKVGEDAVGEIVGAIPGLAQFV
jgi:hypothetical protein